MGFSGTLVVRQDLDQRGKGTLLTLMALSGVGAALIAVALAPLAAAVFHAPRLIGILAVIALLLPLGSIAGFWEAILQRELEFRRRFAGLIVQSTVTAGVSIALAAAGEGVWALVFGQIAGMAALGLVLFAMAPYRVRPTFDREIARSALRHQSRVPGPGAGHVHPSERRHRRRRRGVRLSAAWLLLDGQPARGPCLLDDRPSRRQGDVSQLRQEPARRRRRPTGLPRRARAGIARVVSGGDPDERGGGAVYPSRVRKPVAADGRTAGDHGAVGGNPADRSDDRLAVELGRSRGSPGLALGVRPAPADRRVRAGHADRGSDGRGPGSAGRHDPLGRNLLRVWSGAMST